MGTKKKPTTNRTCTAWGKTPHEAEETKTAQPSKYIHHI